MLVEVNLDGKASRHHGSWDLSGTRFLRMYFSAGGWIVFGALSPDSLHWQHNSLKKSERAQVESSFLIPMPAVHRAEQIPDIIWMTRCFVEEHLLVSVLLAPRFINHLACFIIDAIH